MLLQFSKTSHRRL